MMFPDSVSLPSLFRLVQYNYIYLTSSCIKTFHFSNNLMSANLFCALIQGFLESMISTPRGPRMIHRFVAVNPE